MTFDLLMEAAGGEEVVFSLNRGYNNTGLFRKTVQFLRENDTANNIAHQTEDETQVINKPQSCRNGTILQEKSANVCEIPELIFLKFP